MLDLYFDLNHLLAVLCPEELHCCRTSILPLMLKYNSYHGRQLLNLKLCNLQGYIDFQKLLEELFAECGVPDPVSALAEIMRTHPESDWLARYIEATGLTNRTYRRHGCITRELLACHESVSP